MLRAGAKRCTDAEAVAFGTGFGNVLRGGPRPRRRRRRWTTPPLRTRCLRQNRRPPRPGSHAGAAVTVQRLGTISVVNVRGPLQEAAGPARHAVLLELAEAPAAVLCDLSGVTGPLDPESLERLTSLGEQQRRWPGTPIAVITPDAVLRRALEQAPGGRHLAIAAARGGRVGLARGRLHDRGRPRADARRRSLRPRGARAGGAGVHGLGSQLGDGGRDPGRQRAGDQTPWPTTGRTSRCPSRAADRVCASPYGVPAPVAGGPRTPRPWTSPARR